MRRIVLPLLLSLWSFASLAQHNLSGSIQRSTYTYIYRINAKETSLLYHSNMDELQEKHLHTQVDSFITATETAPALKPGNYLFVQARGNRLEAELKTIDDLQIKLLNNNRDLLVAVHNKNGQLIKDAQVFTGNRKVPYDDVFKVFRIPKKRRAARITVNHQGVLHFLPLTKRPVNFWRKLSYSFPLRYVVQPVRKLFDPRFRYRRNRDYFYGPAAYEKKFTGFMVFSKPKYKPGDTVKLKAWVATKAGKPVNRPLLLRLTDNNFDIDSILTTIRPYRPGGYEYSFVLKDSLDLMLDADHLLTLEEQRSRKYDLEEYDGDLDEDEYALKRSVLMRGKFYYEEYELAAVTFTARSDKKEHNRGHEVAVYCKATDENEMAVMDGRVELLVKPLSYGMSSFYAPKVFLADTLWTHTQALESIGETKILIPDSIFPAASFGYQIVCTFLNSNNEEKTVTLQQHFYNDRRYIMFDEQKDSLYITLTEAGKPASARAMLFAFYGKGDTLRQESLQLPSSIRLDPFAEYYEVRTDSLRKEFRSQASGVISCRSLRTRDSVMVQVVNPHHLSFWYTIFAGNKVIHRGYGDSLLFIDRVRTPKNYFVSLQFIYENHPHEANYAIPYKDKLLNIRVNQPAEVYPGQQVKVDIAVTDDEGMPVSDADVTAYAFTRKFNNVPSPFIPYLGKMYKPRKRYSQFYLGSSAEEEGSIRLNWQRWSREMGLDSIEYYRFLHPSTIYTNTEAVNHGITQIAPFVVLKGELQPVHLLYIDEVPHFFSQAQNGSQYSFAVKPGKHALRIRTHNRLIHLDSIWAAEGMKTFIAINADTSNKVIRQQRMPDTLSRAEKDLWSKYMILVENNFNDRMAVIEQENRHTVLNLLTGRQLYRNNFFLTGPVSSSLANLQVKERFMQSFEPEGSYLFNITKGLIKQKQLPYGYYPFNKRLSWEARTPAFSDFVLTAADVDSLWQDFLDHRNATEDLFRNQSLNKQGNGRLQIGSPVDVRVRPVFIKSIFLFRYDDPDFARIYKGSTRDMGYVQPGMHRLLFLLKEDAYFIMDSVLIQKDGINYYDPGTIIPRAKDSTSMRMSAVINNRESGWRSAYQNEDLDHIKQTFNNRYLDLSRFTKTIYGHVTDRKTGTPLLGVTISVKGTSVATVTDAQGYFQLNVPENGTIVAGFVGFSTVSKKITEESSYDIKMSESENALQEVVVVGYGVARKRELTGAVSSVSSDDMYLAGSAPGIMIRGLKSIQADSVPTLVLVDGLPFSGDWSKMDPALVENINMLKSADATAIYGSRAANGVILITTKKNATANNSPEQDEAAPAPGNTLRINFRDEAFWQPTLRTGADGKTSFMVTYPDDITNWRSFVIAMGSQKRTGFVENSVRSFKALSGAIALPQFAIAGDSIQVIGKTMNYGLDSIRVNRVFSINGAVQKESAISLRNAHIDSFEVVIVPQRDSAQFKYTIQKGDGYFDGEERNIPVFKQGVQETKGFFAALEKDTTFTIEPDKTLGNMTVHAETSVLPVLLDEIESLRNYEYLCNEQVASKLKGLLLKKKVYGYLKKDFKEEKNIRELISRLNQSKSQGGLWGWWNNNTPVLWISLHVTEALLMAEQQKYPVNINKQGVIDYLVFNFDQYRLAEKLCAVNLLQALSSKVDYKKYLDTLDKYVQQESLYEKLYVLRLKQKAGIPIALDTFITKQHHTMFGNLYWGDERYHFFDNSIQNTLAMYHLLKGAGNQEQLLKKIRYYFLEKRRDGKWRNTYESALILETILPDMLSNEATIQPASFTITGNQSAVVNTFPYSNTFTGGEKITITKQTGMPVYFTAYQQSWNPAPQKVVGDFIVQSSFEQNGQEKTILNAGKAVTLKVQVTVKADADYVMVEIPIPAGCSYKDKSQSWSNNEVHREYFKNKVSLFCSSLPKGEYTFRIALLPRYTGRYHLNPAKAEMMYFPVFFGREGMKKISIN